MKKVRVFNINKKKLFKEADKKDLLIDFSFYFFITLGLLIVTSVSKMIDLSPKTATIVWIMIFIPVTFLKFKKDAKNRSKKDRF